MVRVACPRSLWQLVVMKRDVGKNNEVVDGAGKRPVEKLESGKDKGGWQAIAGKAGEDQLFRKAMNLGAKWRKQANTE